MAFAQPEMILQVTNLILASQFLGAQDIGREADASKYTGMNLQT